MNNSIVQKVWKWRTQTWVILILGFAAVLVGLITSYAFATFRPVTEVHVGQAGVYRLWTATTDAELYQGLSGIEQLPPAGGLLMDFKTPGLHGIVMRDMKVPLDIVWLDDEKVVIYIVKNASPELGESKVFTPKRPARYVLELPAGSVQRDAIKLGSIVYFDDLEQGVSE